MTKAELREAARKDILREMEKHPGDAPWSCIDCYHNRPCVQRTILKAALRGLDLDE